MTHQHRWELAYVFWPGRVEKWPDAIAPRVPGRRTMLRCVECGCFSAPRKVRHIVWALETPAQFTVRRRSAP